MTAPVQSEGEARGRHVQDGLGTSTVCWPGGTIWYRKTTIRPGQEVKGKSSHKLREKHTAVASRVGLEPPLRAGPAEQLDITKQQPSIQTGGQGQEHRRKLREKHNKEGEDEEDKVD